MKIQQNQNVLDRFFRIIIGGAIMIATSYIELPTFLVYASLLLGLYLMFSGLSGHCVIYKLFGISTYK